MMLKHRSTVAALSLLALAAVLPAAAQDKSKQPAPPAMGGPEMEAMMKAMSPGEPHKHIARMAGDWTFTNKMWMDPSQPATESSGTMHGEMILGGRYVQTVWKGNFMGMPFEGHGTDGYDNLAKQYVSSWVDNMGTGILYSTGTCDAAGSKCEYKGDMMDPMSGKKSYMRSVMTWADNNSFKNEMYGPGPDGKEAKMMEIVVKRK
jgi:hypothetical protein